MRTYTEADRRASQSYNKTCAFCGQPIEHDQDGVRTVFWLKQKPHCSAKCVTGQPRQPELTNRELWGQP